MSDHDQFSVQTLHPGVWTATFTNPPINLLEPAAILQLQSLIGRAEADPGLKVLVFQSGDPDFFIAHFDTDKGGHLLEARGPTGYRAWQDVVLRLAQAPFVSIAKIRGRARGVGNEFILACDLRYASRQRAVLGNPEIGVGLAPGGGALEWLPRLVGRSRALEIVLTGDDFDADTADRYGWINRAVDDHLLDAHVDAVAARLASFDREALAELKTQVSRIGVPSGEELEASEKLFWAGLSRADSKARRAQLPGLGYRTRSAFELDFGHALPSLAPSD